MSYEYLTVGSQRFDRQGFLQPTGSNYTYKIYHVTAVGSTSGVTMDICATTATTTATVTATKYISLALNNSETGFYSAEWDVHYGRLFDSGPNTNVLIMTCTGFSYAVVDYTVLPSLK